MTVLNGICARKSVFKDIFSIREKVYSTTEMPRIIARQKTIQIFLLQHWISTIDEQCFFFISILFISTVVKQLQEKFSSRSTGCFFLTLLLPAVCTASECDFSRIKRSFANICDNFFVSDLNEQETKMLRWNSYWSHLTSTSCSTCHECFVRSFIDGYLPAYIYINADICHDSSHKSYK